MEAASDTQGAMPKESPEDAGSSPLTRRHPLIDRLSELLRRDFLVGGVTPTYYVTRWIFLRLLGLIHLIAFSSFWWQFEGLIGRNGIAPVHLFLQTVSARAELWQYPWLRFIWVPTLCWISDSNWFLHLMCAAGVIAGVLLLFDIAPPICLAVLFTIYLSLVSVTPDFLGFQWDTLLIEVTFLSILFAPMKLRPGIQQEEVHSRVALMLLRWLLFRLMFMSGFVKFANPDIGNVWRNITAMAYHYETQPLPHVVSWYAHHLPLWFHKASVVGVFFVEMLLPFLLIAPRNVRAVVCAVFVLFQISIGATGNYTFFNLLSITLALLLLDDRHWQYLTPSLLKSYVQRPPLRPLLLPRKVAIGLLGLTLIFVSGMQMCLVLRLNLPLFAINVVRFADSYHVAGRYGLFARMTTTRPEIIIEGSDDAQHWRAYEFKWKPGYVSRAPGWVQPFQPRLDWQMWFAALRPAPPAWFQNLCYRLLEGRPEVTRMFELNPFPDAPPRFVRAVRYQYHFSTPAQRRETGNWWVREPDGIYMYPMSLEPSP